MERYLRRNRLAEFLDGVGVRALLALLSVMTFAALWGLGMPALLAGAALSLLLMMARTRWRRSRVAGREKALRSRIGAEMLLEELLLSEADEAHARAAKLLMSRWPLRIEQTDGSGTLCRQGDERLLIQYLRMLPEGEAGVGDLLSAQRTAMKRNADRIVLCVPGRVSAKTIVRAEEMPLPVRFIRRETLLTLAGRASPATDEQLVTLGQRKRRISTQGGLSMLLFRRDKARRYFFYGLMMLLLYVVTGVRLYAVPGMVCLTMAVISESGERGEKTL